MDLDITEAVTTDTPDFINFTETNSFSRENAPLIYKIDGSKYTVLKKHFDKESNFARMQNELNYFHNRSKRLNYLSSILKK